MVLTVILLLLGLTILVGSGEFLVRGGVGVAKKFHLSPLVIGMTIISFGTSAPELIVSVNAALSGNPEIALGNVIGSNIANLGLVLAMTVIIFPMVVSEKTINVDWFFMFAASVFFYLFALDGTIQAWEGFILFSTLVIFTVRMITKSGKKAKEKPIDDGKPPLSMFNSIAFILVGLVGLYFGSELLLENAVKIAETLGMEQRVIGITIVAFGTSVPELVTSCVAAFRKQSDISIGNLIGSNIFNILSVIGLTAIVKPIQVSGGVIGDLVWMLIFAALLFPLMYFGGKLTRYKGLILLGSYILYITVLLFNT